MDADLAPIRIAEHWPWIKTVLRLESYRAAALALDVLARRQVDAEGEPVAIGRRGWAAEGLTPGEAGGAAKALVRLRDQRVVRRHEGRGRLAHAWSFRGPVANWRGLPWVTSSRDAHLVVWGCRNRADVGVIAQLPGQRRALSRSGYEIVVPEQLHYRRPGLLPVDVRDNAARCATTTTRPGTTPVDVRDNASNSGHPYLSPEGLRPSSSYEEEDEDVTTLREAVEAATGKRVWGEPVASLQRLVNRHRDRVPELVTATRSAGILAPPVLVEHLWAHLRTQPIRHESPTDHRRRQLESQIRTHLLVEHPDLVAIAELERELAALPS